jgi:hypothetical protein
MRIWSLHPRYLDAKGLVALWRESLLAKHVLEGKTRAYRNHPQLNRFKDSSDPVNAINCYLSGVYAEALSRAYDFNREKISRDIDPVVLSVTRGQVKYETEHLLAKLRLRDPERYRKLRSKTIFETHPMFKKVAGGIEEWEVL